ncbi:DNA replication regulator Sld3 [Penicillium expansum]|uniref:DNA replication regulator Sld3 n=1 Tax=Penicillium expansum TaxID=27334 RepID=A0A0A2I310_PENEN|nr:DNA replication regulator Sld3 [Penicillium expansum]KGO36791.1 DNA replication regulator Sld3 [Penicillium expansum]KGO60819.1 DNA replication regulator Sld3 [Penicillium expansum]KGO72586.1 DNA replication regulator Sld3 [Penicillium expansum]
MASRIVPNILDPLSSSALNKLHEPTPPLIKKRKRGDQEELNDAAGQLATSSIVIRAHSASLSDEPLILEPITALPRTRLPLSWLDDTPASRSDEQPGGLFTADIPTLEIDLSAKAEPTVLAVRLMPNGGLYIIERVKRGIYSLSKLARWVYEGNLVVAAKGWHGTDAADVDSVAIDETGAVPDGFDWWQVAQIDEPLSDVEMSEQSTGLDIAVVFGPSESDLGNSETSFVGVVEHRSHSLAPSKSFDAAEGSSFLLPESQGLGDITTIMDIDGVDSNVVDVQQSPEELLDGMRDHYMQALYVSKTSVAYFAKGPLTRCRTAFQARDSEQPHGSTELIESYREAILATKKMDLKYRETLPSAIRDAVLALSDDGAKSKKRKSKKKKMGKNGLYPEEEGFIHRWWKDRILNESSAQESSREAESKKQISDLRLRETQLQILLILEVMVLEMTIASAEKNSTNKEKDVNGEQNTSKKAKPKKPTDLNVLLELHLDRMCIWHAVTMEETSAADTAKASSFSSSHLSGKKVESDAVRDFCTEVIIPFYAARLPDKCKLITRKFGVSGAISPAAKKTQSSSKSHRVEPGAEVKRQQPAPKPRRTLQRVLTDDKAAASHARHPGLTRSNTAPSQHNAKRDIEPLLPTVLSGSVRGGIQKAKRTENREVDLNAVARQHETKLRKVQMLANQKKELDAAIHALRKPNRELVSKDLADDASKRVISGGGSSRKSRNPVRNPFGEGVQVMATPRGNRRKDAVGGLPPLPRSLAPSRSFAGVENSPFGESPTTIPSSSRRAISFSGADSDPFNSHDNLRDGRSPRSSQPDGAIQETPTRPSSKLFQSDTIAARRPSSSTGKGLFRVPNLPAPRSSTQTMVPGSPIHSRPNNISTFTDNLSTSSRQFSQSLNHARTSAIMETPPRRQAPQNISTPTAVPFSLSLDAMVTDSPRAHSPSAVMGTPVKGAAAVPVTPEKSQSKSIYEQLGWDDEMEF